MRNRPALAVGSPQCWCDRCESHFLSTQAFDAHRKIKPQGRSKNDEMLDGGKCDSSKLYWVRTLNDSIKYGTLSDIQTYKKMQLAREARQR